MSVVWCVRIVFMTFEMVGLSTYARKDVICSLNLLLFVTWILCCCHSDYIGMGIGEYHCSYAHSGKPIYFTTTRSFHRQILIKLSRFSLQRKCGKDEPKENNHKKETGAHY